MIQTQGARKNWRKRLGGRTKGLEKAQEGSAKGREGGKDFHEGAEVSVKRGSVVFDMKFIMDGWQVIIGVHHVQKT